MMRSVSDDTVGAPAVTQIRPAIGESEATVLAAAAACGFGWLHPVCRAVVAEALARHIVAVPPGDLQEKPGLGVVAEVNGRQTVLGRRTLLIELGIDVSVAPEGEAGPSQVSVAQSGRYLGRIVLHDRPRSEAHDALSAMRTLGIDRLVLLTGDRAAMAREVGEALGILFLLSVPYTSRSDRVAPVAECRDNVLVFKVWKRRFPRVEPSVRRQMQGRGCAV